jgi:hypothetical protein
MAKYWPALCNLSVYAIYLSLVAWLLLGAALRYQYGPLSPETWPARAGVIVSVTAYLVLIVLDLAIRSACNWPSQKETP